MIYYCFLKPASVATLALTLLAHLHTRMISCSLHQQLHCKLVIICDEYARDYSISFNAVKTKCMVVVPCRHRALFEELLECVFYIGNKQIEFVNSFCHFGHLINSELSDDEEITKGSNSFIGQVNNTLSYFRSLDSLVQHKLFQSYYTSYYSCELWLLNNPKLEYLYVAWRKSMRKICKLIQHIAVC